MFTNHCILKKSRTMSFFIMGREKDKETDIIDMTICANIADHHDPDRSGNEEYFSSHMIWARGAENVPTIIWLGEEVVKRILCPLYRSAWVFSEDG
jgi:hypothetical protein